MASNNQVPSYVPRRYRAWVKWASQKTGLPASVVAAQIKDESNFQPSAVSPTGAEGIAQFEPSTFAEYGHGSPFNVGDSFRAYANYMSTLLQQDHGNVQDALAMYNAGPANASAGMGYANTILNQSHQTSATTVKTKTNANTTANVSCPSVISNPVGWATCNAIGGATNPLTQFFLDPVDALERVGLVVLGALLLLTGIAILGFGPLSGAVKKAAPVAALAAGQPELAAAATATSGGVSKQDVSQENRKLAVLEKQADLKERKLAFEENRERHLAATGNHGE